MYGMYTEKERQDDSGRWINRDNIT
jgi:hypothetical protein